MFKVLHTITSLILPYASLKDYSALPHLREICRSDISELQLTELPTLDPSSLLKEANRNSSKSLRLTTNSILSASPPVPTEIITFASTCHSIATALFNNLSHVLELPWEKYLSEMHQFSVEGGDELAVLPAAQPVERAWSTLTLIFNAADTSTCRVIFSEALSVFAENTVSVGKGSLVEPQTSAAEGGRASHIIYHVRPNQMVYYTRTAGALMTPLNDNEYADRRTVKDFFNEPNVVSHKL